MRGRIVYTCHVRRPSYSDYRAAYSKQLQVIRYKLQEKQIQFAQI